MRIYGAGMAGLLAANMLRRHSPVIHEAQSSLPRNHEALLRFRTLAVSDATGIPFKKVLVLKGIYADGEVHTRPNLYWANLYSQKVSGKVMARSILNLEPEDRYIAPPDFLQQMANSCRIEYGSKLDFSHLFARASGIERNEPEEPYISTIPMPLIVNMIGYMFHEDSHLNFQHKPIWSVTADLEGREVDVYQTLYYPGHEPFYRASITGKRLIVEFNEKPSGAVLYDYEQSVSLILHRVAGHFGITAVRFSDINEKEQTYGKILPVDDAQRREFILHLTNSYNIYSLGRFATWRQILMDDVVNDLKVIESLIGKDSYHRAMHYR